MALINMRNGLMAGGGWKNPYVTDGLVAMWDGEWNAGPELHDPNVLTWVDISGNGHDMSLVSNVRIVGTNYIQRRDGYAYAGIVSIPNSSWSHVEACLSRSMGHALDLGFPSVHREIHRTSTRTFFNGNSLWVNHALSYCISVGYGTDGIALSCYLDGTQVTFGSGGSAYSALSGSKEGVIRLGHDNNSWGFAGRYYNIRLYSRALTAAEIAANYAIDKARFNLPDAT